MFPKYEVSSLGLVNRSIKELNQLGLIDNSCCLTDDAYELIKSIKPHRAIILAAGGGTRMVPINTISPKALIEVHKETLIERIIRHLHEVNIYEIYVVIGFMKEQLEFLIDEYGVNLIVNTEYSTRENLHSLFLAKEHLENAYIVPCDIWSRENPFNESEFYSWYMVSDEKSGSSEIRLNRKMDLVITKHKNLDTKKYMLMKKDILTLMLLMLLLMQIFIIKLSIPFFPISTLKLKIENFPLLKAKQTLLKH